MAFATPNSLSNKTSFYFLHVLICYRGNFVLGYCTFSVTISTSFLRHIVHESIYFMSFLMSVLKMIIMFLNCNGLPQKRLYFKRRVSHNIKQNLSILHCGYFFVFLSLVLAVKRLSLTIDVSVSVAWFDPNVKVTTVT